MNPTERLNNIKFYIKKYEQQGLTADEIIMQLEQLRLLAPVKIVEVEKPVQNPEKAQYLKEWRKEKKKIEMIKEKENIQMIKIKKALERNKFFCFICKKSVIVEDVKNNEYEFKFKRNNKNQSIIVKNKCPICSNLIKSFGGFI